MMFSPRRLVCSGIVLFWGFTCWASDGSVTASFPPAHELFRPLQADPAEPHFGFQFGFPVARRGVARIDVGDYLGIYRWALGQMGFLQLNIGGAINTRFDATTAHNLQVIDFYGNVPLDLRIDRWSLRSMFYHDSSHLGDDYLRETGTVSQNNSWEAWREILSFDPNRTLRIYGGYQQAIHTKPVWSSRRALQAGVEMYFNPNGRGFWQPFWANDLQVWGRSTWDPTWVSQLGFRTGDQFTRGRGITYFIQFQRGPRYEGQFYASRETIWGVGLKFVLSDHLVAPLSPPTWPSSPETTRP